VVIWILFGDFSALLHLDPYPYSYLRIGPDYEELIDGQNHPEAQEDFEEPSGLNTYYTLLGRYAIAP
jgi:hypothetical protein